jgi:hypothetical protein
MTHHVRRAILPFTAIVGQDTMKKALIVNAINPRIGGILIRGEKGTAKSTAVRAFAELLPEIEVVNGCTFNCNPYDAREMCDLCYVRPQLLDRFWLQASVASIDDANMRVEIVKQEKRGKKSWKILTLLLLLATAAFLASTVTAIPGTDGVTRSAPADPIPGAEFDVKLTISGERPLVVGIVETIPEGFDFVSTSHPSDQYEVSAQKITFAVINETEIIYRVKASSLGVGSFTGTWKDMLSHKEGSITGTRGIEEGSTPTPTPATTPTPEVPGFETSFTALTLVIAGLFIVVLRNKGERGRVE